MEQNTTKRRLFFYRAVCYDKSGEPVTFDHATVLKEVSKLPDTAEGRSFQISNNTRLTVHVDATSSPRFRLRFGKTRLTDIPYEETGKFKLQDLSVDPQGGTSDVIHVAFYDNGIVGHVYNHPGPTMGQLAWFLETRCQSIPGRLEFLPLMHPNSLKSILAYDRLKGVTFTLDGGAADFLGNAKASIPLLRAAKDVHEIGKPMTIQLTISRVRDEESLKQVIVDIANNKAIAPAIRQVKVHGTNYEAPAKGKKRGKSHPSAIDLLSAALIFEEPILAYGKNNRTLDDKAAYAKLDELYAAKRDILESAAHVE